MTGRKLHIEDHWPGILPDYRREMLGTLARSRASAGVSEAYLHVDVDCGRLALARRWQAPRLVEVPDLFAPSVPSIVIARHLDLIEATPAHIYILVTTAARRMSEFLAGWYSPIEEHAPLPNLWTLVRASNQAEVDSRVGFMLLTRTAVRGLALWPLCGPVVLQGRVEGGEDSETAGDRHYLNNDISRRLSWVAAAGGVGRGASPVHTEWLRSLRAQCVHSDVPFYFGGWGEWVARATPTVGGLERSAIVDLDGTVTPRPTWAAAMATRGSQWLVERVGRAKAGRRLDGLEHNGCPMIVRKYPYEG